VLTHTHAGVKALKDRIARLAERPRDVHVDTIAGFCLRYALSYPKLSGVNPDQPLDMLDWGTVYEGAGRVADSALGRLVLSASYSGLYVDEYQDCEMRQHRVVMTLAEIMPTRVVLDPLQAVFGFRDAEPVSLERDLAGAFDRLPDLATPHRWARSNPELGEWLTFARSQLETGQPLDLNGAPVGRGPSAASDQRTICWQCARRKGSVVAIGHMPHDVHHMAQTLGGAYTVMEPVESKELQTRARLLDGARGPARASAIVEFAKICMTQAGPRLTTATEAFAAGKIPAIRANTREAGAVVALTAAATSEGPSSLRAAMRAVGAIPGAVIYRRELWFDMDRALARMEVDPGTSLARHAWEVRDVGRRRGRRVEPRTISRTLLIKGLEFDHALVLDADKLDTQNLYVAITRGSTSLTVLSAGQFVDPMAPTRRSPTPQARRPRRRARRRVSN
jgi:DNA helicase-2/ATP-dependent DNA helicase PcrA